jgi:hypothetical protein
MGIVTQKRNVARLCQNCLGHPSSCILQSSVGTSNDVTFENEILECTTYFNIYQ